MDEPVKEKKPFNWAKFQQNLGYSDAEIEGFKAALLRFRDHQGPLHPSPFAGPLTKEKWTALTLVHAAHHLSFLEPKG